MSSSRNVYAILLAILVALGTGCAGVLPASDAYDYFARPTANDAWSPKIGNWQRRARAGRRAAPASLAVAPVSVVPAAAPETAVAEAPTSEVAIAEAPAPEALQTERETDSTAAPLAMVPAAPRLEIPAENAATAPRLQPEPAAVPVVRADLRSKYRAFQTEWRRAMVRDLFAWIQRQAKEHYVSDGAVDHWATLEETLERNGDDCDGLELLVYDTLLALGFDKNQVFRAVVYRPADLQHHMVTLWFEDENDPWVIDPTGAMTDRLVRMSELPDWVPLKLFGLNAEFTVGRLHRRGRNIAGPVAQN